MGSVKVVIINITLILRHDTKITHQLEFLSLAEYIKWKGEREVIIVYNMKQKYMTTKTDSLLINVN